MPQCRDEARYVKRLPRVLTQLLAQLRHQGRATRASVGLPVVLQLRGDAAWQAALLGDVGYLLELSEARLLFGLKRLPVHLVSRRRGARAQTTVVAAAGGLGGRMATGPRAPEPRRRRATLRAPRRCARCRRGRLPRSAARARRRLSAPTRAGGRRRLIRWRRR